MPLPDIPRRAPWRGAPRRLRSRARRAARRWGPTVLAVAAGAVALTSGPAPDGTGDPAGPGGAPDALRPPDGTRAVAVPVDDGPPLQPGQPVDLWTVGTGTDPLLVDLSAPEPVAAGAVVLRAPDEGGSVVVAVPGPQVGGVAAALLRDRLVVVAYPAPP